MGRQRRTTPDSSRLYEVAESQQGLFTTKQAKACGYADNAHPYHVRVGHWLRERRGIYRLAQFPVSDEEQLVLWSLWSMNRREEPQGVYSHSTALAIHDLSDAMPGKLHLTVPRGFRRFRKLPEVLVIHKSDLAPEAIEARSGFAVTTPLRTLVDVATDQTIPEEVVSRALSDALRTGAVRKAELRSTTLPARLRGALEQEAQA